MAKGTFPVLDTTPSLERSYFENERNHLPVVGDLFEAEPMLVGIRHDLAQGRIPGGYMAHTRTSVVEGSRVLDPAHGLRTPSHLRPCHADFLFHDLSFCYGSCR